MGIGVSIILGVTRVSGYLQQVLESIAAQTYTNYDIYIVASGIDGETKKLLRQFVKGRDNATFKNLSVADSVRANDIALSHVKGEYILFWDESILYADNALQCLYDTAISQRADLVIAKVNNQYSNLPVMRRYNDLVYVKGLNKRSSEIMYDLELGNKLLRRDKIASLELSFIEARASADAVFLYRYFINSSNISICEKDVLFCGECHYEKRKNPMRYISPAYFNEIIQGYTQIIDEASDFIEENGFTKEERTAYFKAIYRKRYFTFYECVVKYFWTMRQQTILLLRPELMRGKNHFNTIEWLELQSLFNDIPLDSFPQSVGALSVYREITIALFGEVEDDISKMSNTIYSMFGYNFIRFHIVVPKYVFVRLPKKLKLCKNISFINDYGKNSFYNKVLASCKSRYIMFSSDHYLYDDGFSVLYNGIQGSNADVITTPVHVLDELSDDVHMLGYSKKGFVDYGSNNYDVNTDEAYDCILANKLIKTAYLKSINMTFDGYDFSSSNTILKNACIIRLFSRSVILKKQEFEDKKFKVVDLERVRIIEDKVVKKVLLFTVNGKGFVRNLSLLRDELVMQNDGIYIDYYFNELTDDQEHNQKVLSKLKEFASKQDIVVTAHDFDDSLLELNSNQRFAVILPPHHSIEGDRENGFVFSQKENLTSKGVEGASLFTYGTPEVEYLLNNTNIRMVKDRFVTAYPNAEGRKIIMVTSSDDAFGLFADTDFIMLRDKLISSYFMVVKVKNFERFLMEIPQNLANFVIPCPDWLSFTDQVMVSDVMITTKVLQAYYFAPYNKYLYIYSTVYNDMSQEDRVMYNAMGLESFNDLPTLLKQQVDSIGGARKATKKIVQKLLG